ncbi:MAG: glycosyltransferase family 4 protein [Gemmataceae bacterium]
MKIALCHPHVQPSKGGCERYILDLSRRLVRDGHEVQWHAWTWNAQKVPDKVQCFRVRGPDAPWRYRRPWLFGTACLRSLRAVPHDVSMGFDKTWGQDILFPQGGLYRETALGNRRVPRTALGRLLVKCQQWTDPAYWSFLRLEQRQYGEYRPAIVVNSQMVRDHFLERFPMARDRLHVVPSAIDPARIRLPAAADCRRRLRARWQIPAEATVAVFAAMNYSLKGIGTVLRALRRLPERLSFFLVVVGHPRTRGVRLQATWLGVGARLRLLGHKDHIGEILAAVDLLVHPTFYDPCSLVVLEALTCGLPVITSRYNGAGELPHVRQSGHILDDPHDERELARCMEDLCDPARRALCARAAQRAASAWNFEHHYRTLLEVLGKAAAARSRLLHRAGAA